VAERTGSELGDAQSAQHQRVDHTDHHQAQLRQGDRCRQPRHPPELAT
jgi:hypothetical protein